MTILLFSILLLLVAYCAGILGALTGLGGGIVIIPVLVLVFHVNIHYAMGASLISVMATSSGTAIAYLREGYTNIKIGMFLETGAVIGALVGAAAVAFIPTKIIAIIFGLVLLISAYLSWIRQEAKMSETQLSHSWARYYRLEGTYPSPQGSVPYRVQGVPLGLFIMTMAGMLSGLLGIGSGALKVVAMDQVMRLPYKVATTTSNFIIGITAAVSAGIYLSYGYINPGLTFPVMVGVLLGALSGAKMLPRMHNSRLRRIFSIMISLLAIEIIYKALAGNL